MRCLIIGGSSYIAQAFIRCYQKSVEITSLHRNSDLKSYFDLTESHFTQYDAVINFAAIVHQKKPDLQESQKINTQLPLFLAQKAKEAGVGQFIQLSTIAVYSPLSIAITSETATRPNSIYGKSKLSADEGLLAMQCDDFKVSIVRPPVVYGPNAPGNMQALIRLIQKGWPLPFLYQENQRTILYIENLTSALYRIITQQKEGIFLLRDKEQPSLATLTQNIKEVSGAKSLLFTPPKVFIQWLVRFQQLPFYKLYGDLTIDDQFAQQQLGHYQKSTLQTALKKTIRGQWC